MIAVNWGENQKYMPTISKNSSENGLKLKTIPCTFLPNDDKIYIPGKGKGIPVNCWKTHESWKSASFHGLKISQVGY